MRLDQQFYVSKTKAHSRLFACRCLSTIEAVEDMPQVHG